MQSSYSSARDLNGSEPRALSLGILPLVLCLLILFAAPPDALPQASRDTHPVPILRTKPPAPDPAPPADDGTTPDPGDWAPSLLDAMLSSPNAASRDALLDAAFAAGPDIIPQLQAALKDDRTAEFAAQSLAFIGGPQAFEVLSKLLGDRRDLSLKRFYYGALAEFRSPEATQALLDAVNGADKEDDRSVTESAIIALTVHSDASLVLALRQARTKVQDFVIRDDLDNAIDVIQYRARYLASPKGQNLNGSVDQAVRTYFIPALELAPSAGSAAKPAAVRGATTTAAPAHSASGGSGAGNQGRSGVAKSGASHSPAAPTQPAARPPVKVNIERLTLSPDRNRALARVSFEIPTAVAYYTLVLQKQAGDWTVASVWLGSEFERPAPGAQPKSSSPEN